MKKSHAEPCHHIEALLDDKVDRHVDAICDRHEKRLGRKLHGHERHVIVMRLCAHHERNLANEHKA